jgi:tetratricopeptide (TPR) repeat protein
MLGLFFWPSGKIRRVLLVLAVLQVAGCGSPEDRAQSYYEHGMKFLSEHDNARAAIELRNAVKLKKDLIGAWRALAQIDEINRNWGGVVTVLRTVVELDPNDVAARLKLGQLQLLAGSPDEALNLVNAGIELDGRNADLHTLNAAISFKRNDHVGAIREAQTALELDPSNADALLILAADRLARGDTKGALSFLDSKSVDDAKDLGILLLKIEIFRQAGDLKNAESTLRKLVELYPQVVGFQKFLINFYVGQHRPDDAEKEVRALAAKNQTDSTAALDVVRFLYAVKNDPAAARQELVARISAGGEVFPYQMALADMDFVEGNLTDGKQLLEKLISIGGSSEHMLAAKIALAQMDLNERNFNAAETLTTDILREDIHNASGLKLRASIHLERGQLDAAVADLLEALNYQPRSTELMSLLGTTYERSGLIEFAEKQFADAMRASDFDARVGLEYVAFLQRRGSVGRSEDVLVELNKHRPNNIQVLSALAQVRLARQNWGGAQEIAESIRRIGNDGGAADQILGAALIGRNKYDEAIAAFQNAYKAAPTASQAMDSLVRSFLKANKRDQAMAFLKSVLEKNPGNANALVLLGSIQLTSSAPDQALKNFTAAVKAQPKDVVGYRALAEFYIGQKHYDEAITAIQTGIRQQPDMLDLHLILASVLERKGDYDSAILEYESMLNQQPRNLIVVNNLASLLSDHRTDKASLEKAQSLAASLRKSQIPQFKDTLGWVSYRQGDYRNAVSLMEEAAAALPDQASVRYHLGMGYISTGQLSKASEHLRKALDLAPNNELAEQVRTALKKTGSQSAPSESD